jgi:hypothetical protein
VIHGTYELTRTSLLALALAAVVGTSNAVARLGLLVPITVLLEELLLFSLLIMMLLLLPMLLLRRLLCLGLRLRRGLRSLHLRLLARLPWLSIGLARSVLAAPAPAAMPLRWRLRRLTVVRR